MYCLHCGDCCRRMSPLSAPDPCPHIVEREKDGQIYVLCGVYDRRPEQCRNHDYPSRVCPVGADFLNISMSDALRKRIDDGYELCCSLNEEEE